MKKMKKNENEKTLPDYIGHRKRLRDKFIQGGEKALADYEMLELLLFRCVPRRDTKPIARALLEEFGTLNKALGAELLALQNVKGVKEAIAIDLKIIDGTSKREWKSKIESYDLSKFTQVIEYCEKVIGNQPIEQFRILFLDKKNMLIQDETHREGTIDETTVYPREIIKRALTLNASAMILVHNHPSGDPTPSRHDIDITHLIKQAASVFSIEVHDHIIVAGNEQLSMKKLELM